MRHFRIGNVKNGAYEQWDTKVMRHVGNGHEGKWVMRHEIMWTMSHVVNKSCGQ